ncbi:3-hydroxyacyl-CoA dehydrogenase NAD-binding domain-containing protein [Xinfangfangia pollutisoli]|uniref:3-hydroxyacyl-CoA dehydrogenase NAD-binding domain-containing protein n=1 Tax=Xinfangfangia pollutisoli TaxID=2865960 RepID=UPI001CD475F8|nr:3-hydroxyacyl-CoA dehydrogenase NAD-binding domain-containing protein [Xinfangfangia pollutisoli]
MTKPVIAVIGAGLIGRSWSVLFGAAGHEVRLCDMSQAALDLARQWLAEQLSPAALSRIRFCTGLDEALAGADYVQEAALEDLAVKQALFRSIEDQVGADCVLASSTSALLPDDIFAAMRRPQRCLVAHPANPPHLLPVVELVPAPATDPALLDRVAAMMTDLGQDVIRVRISQPGFVLNRLQSALVEEALRLVAGGVASPEDVDRAVRSGLGMRWAFAGPFEVMDLNASGGFADYAARLGPALAASAPGGSATSGWSGKAPALIAQARRETLDLKAIPARQTWLAGKLQELRRLKQLAREESSEGALS